MEKADKKETMIFGMSKNVFMKKYGIVFILLLMIVFMSIVSPTFRKPGNVVSILQQVSVNGVLAPVSYTHLDVYKRQIWRS